MPKKPKKSGGTPATVALTAAGTAFTVHAYDHDPASPSYGEEAAVALADRRRVGDAADPVEGLDRVVAEARRGTALGQRGGVGHAGRGRRDLAAVADGDHGEAARLGLVRLRQLAHHGAISLLEHVQGQDEAREQYRVQREEGETCGGHSA